MTEYMGLLLCVYLQFTDLIYQPPLKEGGNKMTI